MALVTCTRTSDCWCRDCHALRIDQYTDCSLEGLKQKFLTEARREEQDLKAVFTHVLESSAIAKCFKQKLYHLSDYKYVKPYLKQTGYSDELAGKLARDISMKQHGFMITFRKSSIILLCLKA